MSFNQLPSVLFRSINSKISLAKWRIRLSQESYRSTRMSLQIRRLRENNQSINQSINVDQNAAEKQSISMKYSEGGPKFQGKTYLSSYMDFKINPDKPNQGISDGTYVGKLSRQIETWKVSISLVSVEKFRSGNV